MRVQSQLKSGLANRRWAGERTNERERDGSCFASYLLPTGQGRKTALGPRHKMSRTNALTLCQKNLRAWASESQLASWEP